MPYLETKLGKINYKIKRKKNSPFIVFIGGLGSNISSREDQMKYFSKYFSVLIFDNLGSGKSNKPDTDYSMEMFASNCNEIMELLKIPSAHIIGNSMGGMIAQVFASKFPKKVNKLILACTCSTRDKISKENLGFYDKILSITTNTKRPVIIFPQATRTAIDDKQPFKKGVSKIYEKLNFICVPVALNSGIVWPKSGKLNSNRTITVSILENIPAGLNSKDFLKKLLLIL